MGKLSHLSPVGDDADVTTAPAQPAPAPAVPALSEPPDWEHIARDVACPLCEYNLRGLVEPRCPECGYAFEWHVLLDDNLRLHEYVFEHHAERSAWSFRRTLLGGLRPGRFWRSLRPEQPSIVRRLRMYWMICAFALLAAAVAAFFCCRPSGQGFSYGAFGGYGWWSDSVWNQPRWVLRQFFGFLRYDALYTLGALTLAAWPWASLAALLVYQQSMGKAKIRAAHLVRCVVYSADAMVWAAIAIALVAAAAVTFDIGPSTGEAFALAGVIVAAYLVACYRLFRAYQLYLKFHRPLLTVLAAQVIVLLAFLVAATQLNR
jgi:hypothetical protein